MKTTQSTTKTAKSKAVKISSEKVIEVVKVANAKARAKVVITGIEIPETAAKGAIRTFADTLAEKNSGFTLVIVNPKSGNKMSLTIPEIAELDYHALNLIAVNPAVNVYYKGFQFLQKSGKILAIIAGIENVKVKSLIAATSKKVEGGRSRQTAGRQKYLAGLKAKKASLTNF